MEALSVDFDGFYHKEFLEYILKFNGLLNSSKYFEAHELLEELWKKSKKRQGQVATTKALKGLINASIAFEHIKRAKPKSQTRARATFDAYKKYRVYIPESDFRDILMLSTVEIERVSKRLQLN